MADWFLDSSAVVKRYMEETGTNWVRSILDPVAGHRAFLAGITGVEVVSAITRRKLSGGLLPGEAALAINDFRRDLANEYWVLDVIPSVLARAMTLAETRGLRGYDAVQLATALEDHMNRLATGMPALTLISADHALNTAAQVEGLLVDNPNMHP